MERKMIGLIFIFALLILGLSSVAAQSVNLIDNAWALGIDNASGCPGDIDSGWVHSATVSLSRCPKNPSPFGPNEPGAAFKNGPVMGPGQPGVETLSYQEFILPYATSHTLQFQSLIICVRCDYLHVDLYGDGQYLGRLLDYNPHVSIPDYYYDSTDRIDWPGYIGPELTVMHYETYRLEIKTMFTAFNSLGVKWTGMQLVEK